MAMSLLVSFGRLRGVSLLGIACKLLVLQASLQDKGKPLLLYSKMYRSRLGGANAAICIVHGFTVKPYAAERTCRLFHNLKCWKPVPKLHDMSIGLSSNLSCPPGPLHPVTERMY